MRVEVNPSEVWASPGAATVVQLTIVNDSDVIDEFTIETLRDSVPLPPGIVEHDASRLGVFPGDATVVELAFTPDRTFDASCHEIAIICSSTALPGQTADICLRLNVTAVEDLRLAVRPKVAKTRRDSAPFSVEARNRGNTPRSVRITGVDAEGLLTFRFARGQIEIPPMTSEVVEVVGSVRRPMFGTEVRREILFGADDLNDPTAVVEPAAAQLVQRPRIPQFVLLVLAMLIGFGFWTVLFSSGADDVTDEVNEADLTEAALLDDFNGVRDADGLGGSEATAGSPAAVAARVARQPGSIRGSVAAASDDSAVDARVRVYHADDPSRALQTARADAGKFELTVLPGSYLLRFDGPGFVASWYPSAATPSKSEIVEVSGGQDVELNSVRLDGVTGSILGLLRLPDGDSGQTTGIRAEVKSSSAPPTAEPEASVDVDELQRFRLGGLATPGEYRVELTGVRYQPVTLDVTLGPGGNVVLDAIDVFGGDGVIAGTVRIGENGVPAATVIIEANDAPLRLEATTPSEPPATVGDYRIDRLRTPGDYTVTVEAAGFASVTIPVSLAAGDERLDIDVDLTSTVASLSGGLTVIGAQGGTIDVTVTGGAGDPAVPPVVRTATAVIGADGSGRYNVTDLVAPGTYTVVFSGGGTVTAAERIVIGPGDNTLNATLEPIRPPPPESTSVRIRVVGPADGTGGALLGGGGPLFVTLGDLGPQPANADGTAVFDGVGPGLYRVSVFNPPPGLRGSIFLFVSTAAIESGSPVDRELPLVRDTFTLGVEVVVDNDGQPARVPDAAVTASDASGAVVGTGSTDSSGIVSFADLPLGTYTVTADRGSPTQSTVEIVAADVLVTIAIPNITPTADAGPDIFEFVFDEATTVPVELDGSGSSDADGSIVMFVWSSGGAEIASGPQLQRLQVDAPIGSTTYTLTVVDDLGGVASDDVVVTVEFGSFSSSANPFVGAPTRTADASRALIGRSAHQTMCECD